VWDWMKDTARIAIDNGYDPYGKGITPKPRKP
jgi:hypothetical protein